MKILPASFFGVALAIMISQSLAVMAQEADASLEAFFQEYLEETFALRPMDATRLGDHRFDHLLDDVSSEARAGWLAHARRKLAQLPQRVEYDHLSRPAQIDYE